MSEVTIQPASWVLFREYEEALKSENRFFPDEKFLRLFDVIIKSNYHHRVIAQGTHLYRARRNRLGSEFEFVSDLGMNKDAPTHNRASPIGIPYMYLAGNPETAIAEVRANVNDYVSVATYETVKPLNLLYLDQATVIDYAEEDGEFRGLEIVSFISQLSFAFAAPVQKKAEVEYLPTQYFAEYCKRKGLDGIQYVSSARGFGLYGVGDTHFNYVLFDDTNVAFCEAYRYKVEKIEYRINKECIIHLKDG